MQDGGGFQLVDLIITELKDQIWVLSLVENLFVKNPLLNAVKPMRGIEF